MGKIPDAANDDDDDGPALAGNSAAANPDGVKSADIAPAPDIDDEDDLPGK